MTIPMKALPLQTYAYGVDQRVGYAFATNTAGEFGNADFAANHTLKMVPGVQLSSTKAFSNTVQENMVRVLSGKLSV